MSQFGALFSRSIGSRFDAHLGSSASRGGNSSHAALKKSFEMPSKWQKPNQVKRSSTFAALTLVFSELLVCELASILIELTEISQVM